MATPSRRASHTCPNQPERHALSARQGAAASWRHEYQLSTTTTTTESTGQPGPSRRGDNAARGEEASRWTTDTPTYCQGVSSNLLLFVKLSSSATETLPFPISLSPPPSVCHSAARETAVWVLAAAFEGETERAGRKGGAGPLRYMTAVAMATCCFPPSSCTPPCLPPSCLYPYRV